MGFGNLLVKYGLVEATETRDYDAIPDAPPKGAPAARPAANTAADDDADIMAELEALGIGKTPPAGAPRAAAPDAAGEIDAALLAELEAAVAQVETDAFDYTDYVQLRARLEEQDPSQTPEKVARTVGVFAEAQGATVDDVIASAEAARAAVEAAGAQALERTETEHATAEIDADAERTDVQASIEAAEREIEEARALIVSSKKRLVDMDDEAGTRTAGHGARTASIGRTVRETLAEIDADVRTLQGIR